MLVRLLNEDGIKVVRQGASYKALCPFHSEKTPSFSINATGEVYHCFGCGAKGDAVDYLVGRRKMDRRDAVRLAGRGHGASNDRPAAAPPPAPAAEPNKWLDALPDNHAGRYTYRSRDGKVMFVVQRYEIDGRKVFGQYTRARRGKDGPLLWVKGLLVKDRRPLYRLPEIADRNPRRIIVVEGEKCADAVAQHMKTAVTTWAGGAGAWRRTSWKPLKGRRVLLIADGDAEGHAAMKGLAEHLNGRCHVTLCLPPIGPEKMDIADELQARPDTIGDWIKRHICRPDVPEWLANGGRFRVVSVFGGGVVIEVEDGQRLDLLRADLARPLVALGLEPDPKWWEGHLGAPLSADSLQALWTPLIGP